MPRRESRNSKVKKKNLLVPINYQDFGSENDPCFGKLYDLNENECLACGDIELCGMAFGEVLKKKRLLQEAGGAKDLEIDTKEFRMDVKKFYNKYVKQTTPLKARLRTAKRFNISREEVKKLIA